MLTSNAVFICAHVLAIVLLLLPVWVGAVAGYWRFAAAGPVVAVQLCAFLFAFVVSWAWLQRRQGLSSLLLALAIIVGYFFATLWVVARWLFSGMTFNIG